MTGYTAAEAAWGDHEVEPVLWNSGPWSLEVRGDELADIRFAGALVLRSVRAVVRDRDWATVAVERLSLSTEGGIMLGLRFLGLGADIAATLQVSLADGLVVEFRGESRTDFERNRIGLVVLHPPGVAGSGLTVVSPGGETHTNFPLDIAPHQPALDIAALRWQTLGVDADLAFEGDTFEMEDQRNWTDASFKTYSTPLALPFPVLVRAGEAIEQSIVLRCAHTDSAVPDAVADVISFIPRTRRVPSITVGASTAPNSEHPSNDPETDDAVVLVELILSTPNWHAALDRAASSGWSLDVRIVASTPHELDAVLDLLGDYRLARLGVYSASSHVSETELWNALVAGVAVRGIHADLVGGARSHFTELNREHDRLPALPALTFSITPQMHATERAQLVESIGMQRLVAQNAVRIAAGRLVHVGPVTLRSRFNAVATSAQPASTQTELDEGYGAELVEGSTDPRQTSTALAAWTIASAAALSVDGIASIAYFEQWGARGIRDATGEFPVAAALQETQALAGQPLLEVTSRPENVWVLAAETPDGPVALVANLNTMPTSVTLGIPFDHTVVLPPLAYVRVDGQGASAFGR